MPRGDAIYNPDVQSDIDMKNTWKLVNYPGSILPSIPVSQTVFVDTSGNDTSAAASDFYHPAKTISKAVTLATALTPTSSNPVAIVVGPGTFTENSGVKLPNYVSLLGSGMDVTILQSSRGNTVAPVPVILAPGTNSIIADLTVVGTAPAPNYQGLIGQAYDSDVTQTDFSIARVYRVHLIGDSDGFFIHTQTASLLRVYDSFIETKFDATMATNGATIELYNCTSIVTGPSLVSGSGPANAASVAGTTGGTVRIFGGSYKASGSTQRNTAFEVLQSGTLEVYGAKTDVSGIAATDTYNTVTGTLKMSGVSRVDGGAIVQGGFAPYTEISRYVTRDKNLSEVATTTPTWTGQHIWKFDGLAATQDDSKGLLFENTTAATNGTQQQISPAIRWRGFGWHTVGPSSQSIDFRQYVIPITGTGAARAYLTFEASLDGGAYSNLLALFLSGGMSLGSTTDPGYGKFNALNGIYVNGSPVLTTTGLKLVHESDATADTDTFFFSTDSSGLAYKDAFNVIHPITGAGTSATIQSTLLPLKGDNTGNAIAATVTGTGNVVLDTSPTLATPTIGVATATSVNKWTLTAPSTSATLTAGADNLTYTMPEISTKVGFRHIPQNSQSASYTTVLNDSGKHIYHPAADANNRTITIDSNANVAYPIGTAIMFVNMSANNLSIAITADTMYLAGAGTTGTRTLAQYGKATAVKTGTTEWVISGIGLS